MTRRSAEASHQTDPRRKNNRARERQSERRKRWARGTAKVGRAPTQHATSTPDHPPTSHEQAARGPAEKAKPRWTSTPQKMGVKVSSGKNAVAPEQHCKPPGERKPTPQRNVTKKKKKTASNCPRNREETQRAGARPSLNPRRRRRHAKLPQAADSRKNHQTTEQPKQAAPRLPPQRTALQESPPTAAMDQKQEKAPSNPKQAQMAVS